ncbi:hypothetical protein TNCV_3121961 [Trichonephila clavipes]|nr:hypothetical protein TNCV_3121961 [Trichonephila clavipes]
MVWLVCPWPSAPKVAGSTKSCGRPVVKVSDHGRHVMSSSPVSLKTRRVGSRSSSRGCTAVEIRADEQPTSRVHVGQRNQIRKKLYLSNGISSVLIHHLVAPLQTVGNPASQSLEVKDLHR